jgi:hypothetical protein
MSSEARSISCESPFNGGSCKVCCTNWGSQFYEFFNRVRIFWQFFMVLIIFNFYQGSVVKQDQFITYLLSDALISADNVLWIHRHASSTHRFTHKQAVRVLYVLYSKLTLPYIRLSIKYAKNEAKCFNLCKKSWPKSAKIGKSNISFYTREKEILPEFLLNLLQSFNSHCGDSDD